jgi:hypothetical protein
MRFKILGANMETGDDVDVIFDAPSQPEVEKLAHEKGILVSSIAAVPAAAQAPVASRAATGAPIVAHALAAPGARAATGAPVAVGAAAPGTRAATGAPIAAPGARAATGAPIAAPGARAATGAPIAAPGARAATGAPIGSPPPHKPVERDLSSIALIDDDPPANGSDSHAERAHGLITVNANSPGETAHTGAGTIEQAKHADAAMEYHVIINQSLFLLESTVNKHIRDGWEPQGGLTVGVSNNALQFFQAMIRRLKTAETK